MEGDDAIRKGRGHMNCPHSIAPALTGHDATLVLPRPDEDRHGRIKAQIKDCGAAFDSGKPKTSDVRGFRLDFGGSLRLSDVGAVTHQQVDLTGVGSWVGLAGDPGHLTA